MASIAIGWQSVPFCKMVLKFPNILVFHLKLKTQYHKKHIQSSLSILPLLVIFWPSINHCGSEFNCHAFPNCHFSLFSPFSIKYNSCTYFSKDKADTSCVVLQLHHQFLCPQFRSAEPFWFSIPWTVITSYGWSSAHSSLSKISDQPWKEMPA